MNGRAAPAHPLRDLARLRRVRDRIDREYAQPLDVEALARGEYMSAGHFSRQFKLAFGESPCSYPMTRRIGRAMALLRRTGGHVARRLPARGGAGDERAAVLRGAPGDATGQMEKRRPMRPDWHDGSRRRMRWITVGPPDQPGTSIVLYLPAASTGVTDDEKHTIAGMMAKGTCATMLPATRDLDAAFAKVRASGAGIVEEPTMQPCAVRDPAGNLLRVQERRRAFRYHPMPRSPQ